MTVHRIVVGADGSLGSARALLWAGELAAQVDAEVTVVHVFEPLAMLSGAHPPIDFAELEDQARHELEDDWCRSLSDLDVKYTTRVVEGSPTNALVAVAEEVGADLIVVGDRGHKRMKRLMLGSTALKLPRETMRPVTIIRTPEL